jgi:hemerythrin-like domain-containing protein
MNALTLLKQDHANVEELFKRFETAAPSDTAELARVRDIVIEQLSKHAAIEEQVFYPAVRAKLGDEQSFAVLEGLEEHHIVKITLAELEKMPPTHERFRPKMTVLIESVRHHVEEEENEIFEQVREAFTVEELNDMGEEMEKAKAIAPSRPHPLLPDQPPLNVLLGVPAAVIDLTVTTAKEFVGSLSRSRHGKKAS